MAATREIRRRTVPHVRRGSALLHDSRRSQRSWGDYFPTTHKQMAAAGLAYYHGGDPSKPVVYEDFLPASAAGIFWSNLDIDAQTSGDEEDRNQSDYNVDWMAGQIEHHIHDPYELYEKVASS